MYKFLMVMLSFFIVHTSFAITSDLMAQDKIARELIKNTKTTPEQNMLIASCVRYNQTSIDNDYMHTINTIIAVCTSAVVNSTTNKATKDKSNAVKDVTKKETKTVSTYISKPKKQSSEDSCLTILKNEGISDAAIEIAISKLKANPSLFCDDVIPNK